MGGRCFCGGFAACCCGLVSSFGFEDELGLVEVVLDGGDGFAWCVASGFSDWLDVSEWCGVVNVEWDWSG